MIRKEKGQQQENNQEITDSIESIMVQLDKVKCFTLLLQNYIDFTPYNLTNDETKNALMTLHNLTRLQESNLVLCYEIDEILANVEKELEKNLKLLYAKDHKN